MRAMLFFFSSRRRHTRFDCDWSSDVCSSDLLAGALERERLIIRPAQFFAAHQVDTQLGRRVSEILRREQRVRLDDNTLLAYDALLLATGSRPRSLDAPGTELPGVHVLRTLARSEEHTSEL